MSIIQSKKTAAPLTIAILAIVFIAVVAIVVSNGYFGLQSQQNRLEAEPTVATELGHPAVPEISILVETEEATTETIVGPVKEETNAESVEQESSD